MDQNAYQGVGSQTVPQVSDPRRLRALAHPARLALWMLLSVHGPLTATQAAEFVDDSPSNCSFHLRQLARYGFVEEAGKGRGRSRPWRVTGLGLRTMTDTGGPNAELAAQSLGEVLVTHALERYRRWQRERRAAPPEWRSIGGSYETVWWITPDEARQLEAEVEALLHRYRDRLLNPHSRPADSKPITLTALIYPFDSLSNGESVGGTS